MSELAGEFIKAAYRFYGDRFHAHSVDACEGGTVTRPACMQEGLTPKPGLSCDGLVIVSMCLVRGIKPSDWPPEYRHVEQMESLKPSSDRQVGDAVIFRREADGVPGYHMGIVIGDNRVLHATFRQGGRVRESPVRYDPDRDSYIKPEQLIAVADSSARV